MHAAKFWAITRAHLLGVSNFLTICHDVFIKQIIFRTGPRKWKLCSLLPWCNIWKKRKLPAIKTPKVPISELSFSLVTGLWDLFYSLNRRQINPSINNKNVCEIAVSPLHEMCWMGSWWCLKLSRSRWTAESIEVSVLLRLKGTQSADAHAHWIPFLSWCACHKTRVKQKRIRNTLNKPCRVELVTSQNRDYRP